VGARGEARPAVKVVVADTGPVLHLHQAGALDLLPAL
jgi:hypothetical protein